MALIACPGCDTAISDHLSQCPHCGRSLGSPKTPPAAPQHHPSMPRAEIPHVPHLPPRVPHPSPPPRILQPRPVPQPGAPKPKGKKGGCLAIGCIAIVLVLAFFYIVGMLAQKAGYKPKSQVVTPAQPTDAEKAQEAAKKSLQQGRESMDKALHNDPHKSLTGDAAEQARKLVAHTIAAELSVEATVRGVNNDRVTLQSPSIDAKWTEEFRKGEAFRALQNAGFRRIELKDGKKYRERIEVRAQ